MIFYIAKIDGFLENYTNEEFKKISEEQETVYSIEEFINEFNAGNINPKIQSLRII